MKQSNKEMTVHESSPAKTLHSLLTKPRWVNATHETNIVNTIDKHAL
jgi:hypothetical protein